MVVSDDEIRKRLKTERDAGVQCVPLIGRVKMANPHHGQRTKSAEKLSQFLQSQNIQVL